MSRDGAIGLQERVHGMLGKYGSCQQNVRVVMRAMDREVAVWDRGSL